jgi:hypothetical protein
LHGFIDIGYINRVGNRLTWIAFFHEAAVNAWGCSIAGSYRPILFGAKLLKRPAEYFTKKVHGF